MKNDENNKGKGGRPRIDFNYDKFDSILQFKVTKDFCADHMGVSKATIDDRLKEDHGMTFREYHELKLGRTGVRLQQKAIELALGMPSKAGGKERKPNIRMLELALKNFSGWSDKVETEVDHSVIVNVKSHEKE